MKNDPRMLGWTKSREIVAVGWTSYRYLNSFGSLFILMYFISFRDSTLFFDLNMFLTSRTYSSLVTTPEFCFDSIIKPDHFWGLLLEWDRVSMSWPARETMLDPGVLLVHLGQLLCKKLAEEAKIIWFTRSEAWLISFRQFKGGWKMNNFPEINILVHTPVFALQTYQTPALHLQLQKRLSSQDIPPLATK